jgi:nucleoside phosphorylase
MDISVLGQDNQPMNNHDLKAVIITALSLEYEAVRTYLTDPQEQIHPQGTIYECGKFLSDAQTWEIGIVEIGQGNTRSAAETERAIQYFQPDVILFVGVAGGLKDVALGDVVVANKVYGYESGKDEVTFKTRPDVMNSTYRLEQRARAEAKKGNWVKRIKLTSSTKPRAFVGPVAAGGKVVASTKSATYKFIRDNYNDALAVEMEGYGFLESVRVNPEIEALVIRGISDLIDYKDIADITCSQETAAQNASAFAFEMLANFTPQGETQEIRQWTSPDSSILSTSEITPQQLNFKADPRIDSLIKNIKVGDWDSAANAAIEILKTTEADGGNQLFNSLLTYQDYPKDDDMLWAAMMVIETYAQLSPSLINHKILARMATHKNFTVRSSAASICMEFAQFAPNQVPVDILLDLSKHDEDWYVQAPANAALKAIASSQPAVLHIYYQRLISNDPNERAHAAYALLGIAQKEPEILDLGKLKRAHARLVQLGDKEARNHIESALPLVQQARDVFRYKYGI